MLIKKISGVSSEKIRIKDNFSQFLLECTCEGFHKSGVVYQSFDTLGYNRDDYDGEAFGDVLMTAYVERSGKNVEIFRDVPINIIDSFSRNINDVPRIFNSNNAAVRFIDMFGEGYLKINTGEELILEFSGLKNDTYYSYNFFGFSDNGDSKEIIKIDKKSILVGETKKIFDILGYERLFIPNSTKTFIEEIELSDSQTGDVLKIDRKSLSYYYLMSSDKYSFSDVVDYRPNGEVLPVYGFDKLTVTVNQSYSSDIPELHLFLQSFVLNEVAVQEQAKENYINEKVFGKTNFETPVEFTASPLVTSSLSNFNGLKTGGFKPIKK